MVNNMSADDVVRILATHAKHKKEKVFTNELVQFLRSDKEEYYFLSEDYYEHRLRRDERGVLFLVVESEKEDIVSRTSEANSELRNLYL